MERKHTNRIGMRWRVAWLYRHAEALLVVAEGNRAVNIEQAIDLCQYARTILDATRYPYTSAVLTFQLARAYTLRIYGDHHQNQAQAHTLLVHARHILLHCPGAGHSDEAMVGGMIWHADELFLSESS